MALMTGTRLGPYEITAPIGAGGMGEVYRATDTKLKRDVAIKVLPENVAGDRERLTRFEREAHVLASLNHPHIAAIYGLEEFDGVPCLVLELVEGETLAERLEAGVLPVDEALGIVRQIALALEAAQEKGIIHRDLKPGNVKVTPEGTVKVLDFGLAKAFADNPAESPADASLSPTMTMAATRAGVILGTAAYMSPEQARGKPINKRTDIWAFGCVLYEMLTGQRAFPGETASDVIARILEREPDWEKLPGETPPKIRDLMKRCLRRDHRDRLHDIADARIEVDEVLADLSAAGEVSVEDATRTAQPAPGFWVALIVAAGILGATVPFLLRTPDPARPFRKLEVVAGERPEVVELEPALSPDGTRIVYQRDDRLWLRALSNLEPRELPGTEGGHMPFWSPDGAWLGYFSGESLWKISPAGGSPVTVAAVPSFSRFGGAVWTDDNQIALTTGGSGLLHVSAQGGELTPLLDPDEAELDFHFASLLPSGGIIFVVHSPPDVMDQIDIYVDGGRRNLVRIEGATLMHPEYSPTGHLLYVRLVEEIGLWAVPFSLTDLAVIGEPFLVDSLGRDPTVSSEGLLAYTLGGSSGRHQLVWIDREGKMQETLTEPRRRIAHPRLSPDGRQVAFTEFLVGSADIWVQAIGGGNRSRISGEGQMLWFCDWSPDSTQIAYVRGPGGKGEMILRPADGSGEPKILGQGSEMRFSPDGRYILHSSTTAQGRDLYLYPMDGGDVVSLFDIKATSSSGGEVSPDGKYIAYESGESGRDEIYVSRFPSGEGRWQVSTAGGARPLWSPRGDRLFFTRLPQTLMEVEVSTDPGLKLGTPRELFTAREGEVELFMGFDAAADGERFLAVRLHIPEPRLPTIAVVENWVAGFD